MTQPPLPIQPDLIERLNKIESDPIGCGLAQNWHRNPDGPEAATAITTLQAQRDEFREALGKAVETLAAGRHLIGKYTPDHHWLSEHDKRIDELKALAAPQGGV